MPLKIHQFSCLSDNYGYLIRDEKSGAVAAIDTPCAETINAQLEQLGWALSHIFNTHWHLDHAGGNLALKDKWACEIVGPRGEAAKIPGIDRAVGDNDVVMLGDSAADIYDTPGHTAGHIIFHFAAENAAFVGDTIFALGCGRLFEGSPEQMWHSLQKVAGLPRETNLYCAHEYTTANAQFAVTVDPENAALAARCSEIAEKRARNIPTVPSTLAIELETNPFLRADQPGIQRAVKMDGHDPIAVFAEVRSRKDAF